MRCIDYFHAIYAILMFQGYIPLLNLIISETNQYKQNVNTNDCPGAALNANSIEHWITSVLSWNDTISENVQFRDEEVSLLDHRMFVDEFYRVITLTHQHTYIYIYNELTDCH